MKEGKKMLVDVVVNGKRQRWEIHPGEFLIDTLRRYGYKSVRKGCDDASCCNCTVIVDGRAVLSCVKLTASVKGKNILTLEGIKKEKEFLLLEESLLKKGAVQCGYCISGLIMTVWDFSHRYKDVSEKDEIKYYTAGNLCRCTGYNSQIFAIKDFIKKRQETEKRD